MIKKLKTGYTGYYKKDIGKMDLIIGEELICGEEEINDFNISLTSGIYDFVKEIFFVLLYYFVLGLCVLLIICDWRCTNEYSESRCCLNISGFYFGN